MAVARLWSITLDCDDPGSLAGFWCALLDGEIAAATEKFVAVRTPHLLLTAIRVPDYRPPSWPENTVPKQIHLDIAVDDLDAAADRAVSLGATLVAFQAAPDRCRVLRDPAGHLFCVCIPPAGM
ncbi:VOC family protein [Antrihabitans sp. YC2-6]|uniref:VOC family protein n=1 Tax=Antrihabitans sp. YC2-6 TaxID=2799498 RepID=UPI0027DB0B03|nr:VOC family protein [Antrihabitans sp. YC2-6]